MLIKTPLSFRHSFTSKPGFVIIGCDFKSQELKTAAYLSQDPALLQAFTDPPELTREENGVIIKYANPHVDLHTKTSVSMYPEVFKNKPEWEWIELASNTVIDGMIIRKASKITNFGLQFGQSAKALAELNYIKLNVAESWVQGHKLAYPVFHLWADNQGRIAEARGWASTQLSGKRWCNESNSKGQEDGALGRLAVNFLIQGLIHWPL